MKGFKELKIEEVDDEQAIQEVMNRLNQAMRKNVLKQDQWLIDQIIDIYNHLYIDYQDYYNTMVQIMEKANERNPYLKQDKPVVISEELFRYIRSKNEV